MSGQNLSVVAAWYAAGVSSLMAAIGLLDRRRARRVRIAIQQFVVWSPRAADQYEPRLHLEAVNLGQRPVSLRQWTLIQEPLGQLAAGSPYEGRFAGPEMLQPGQMHGWEISDPGSLMDLRRPATVLVTLTTGERFETAPFTVESSLLERDRSGG